MSRQTIRYLALAWGNPYTAPPAGADTIDGRIRWCACTLPGVDDADLWLAAPPHVPGDGWARHVNVHSTAPPRTWSPETKARVRRGNLRKRLTSKAPLFAEQLYERELAANPAYYDGASPNHAPQGEKASA